MFVNRVIIALIKDWYINRAEREARLSDLKGMVAAKKDAKSSKAPIEK